MKTILLSVEVGDSITADSECITNVRITIGPTRDNLAWNVPFKVIDPAPEPVGLTAQSIFEHIKHGDAEHQRWLMEKLSELFARPPIKAPYKIYHVSNKIASMLFLHKKNAEKFIAARTVTAGLTLTEIHLIDAIPSAEE